MKKVCERYDVKKYLREMALGNEESFRKIYLWHRKKVYENAFLFTQCAFAAEDITQDAFLKIWEKRKRLDGMENFRCYLMITIRNLCLNHLKKNKIELIGKNAFSRFSVIVENNVEPNYLAKEYRAIFQKAIDTLPPKRRQVFRLLGDGMRYDEIAESLNISINTVRNQKALGSRTVWTYVRNKLEIDFKTGMEKCDA